MLSKIENGMDRRMFRYERREYDLARKVFWGVITVLLAAGSYGSAAAEIDGATFTYPRSPNFDVAALTPDQMRAAVADLLPAMDQLAQTIRRQLEQARHNRDIVKVLCLSDELVQVDTVLRSTRDRLQSLDDAARRKDLERTRHEFSVVQVLSERMRLLSQEAAQCVGSEVGFIDEAKVIVEVDPTLPRQDPTILPVDPLYSMAPTISSPTR